MPALVENGWTFQANNEPAWHKEGTTFPSTVDPDAGWLAMGGHVVTEHKLQAIIDAQNTIDCHKSKALFRIGAAGDIKELAHVSPGYTVVQPRTSLHLFDELIKTGLVELETGGWLENGIMWAQARLCPAIAEVVPGDAIRRRLLLTLGFDGKHQVELNDADERTVCANTMAIAKGQSKAMFIKLRHTKSVHERLDQAMALVKANLEGFAENIEAYRQLTKVKLTAQNMKEYFWKVFAPEADTEAKQQDKPRIKAKISHVIDLLDAPEYVPVVRGTAWHCYNAVSHYVSHDSNAKNDNNRLQSLWFGTNADINQRAMNEALSMVN